MINKAQTVGSVSLFSVRRTFVSQWAKFQSTTINGTTPTAELQLSLVPELYPFWSKGLVGSNPVKAIEFFAELSVDDTTSTVSIYNKADKSSPAQADSLNRNPLFGNLLMGSLVNIKPLPAAVTDATHAPLTLYFDNNSMEDLWLAITWGKS